MRVEPEEIKVTLLLTPYACDIVNQKVYEYGLRFDSIVDSMIREFAPSTSFDRREQINERAEAREKFIADNPVATPTQIWNHGYSTGWQLYQMRHYNTFINRIKRWKKSGWLV